MGELETLLARCEAATGVDRELDRDIGFALGGWEWSATYGEPDIYVPEKVTYYTNHPDAGYPSFTNSIDAALALVERLLPGWDYCLMGTLDPDKRVFAETLPLAIICALLRTLIARRTETT